VEHRLKPPKVFDPKEKMSVYRASAKGLGIFGEDDTVTQHRKASKRRLHLIPAPWSLVFVTALLYAFGVNIVRLAWYEYFGRPDIFKAQPQIEAELDALARPE